MNCPRCTGWMAWVREIEGWEWHCANCSHSVEGADPPPSRLRPLGINRADRRRGRRRCTCGQPIARTNRWCWRCYLAERDAGRIAT